MSGAGVALATDRTGAGQAGNALPLLALAAAGLASAAIVYWAGAGLAFTATYAGGLAVSALFDLPAGPAIVIALAVLALLGGRLLRRRSAQP